MSRKTDVKTAYDLWQKDRNLVIEPIYKYWCGPRGITQQEVADDLGITATIVGALSRTFGNGGRSGGRCAGSTHEDIERYIESHINGGIFDVTDYIAQQKYHAFEKSHNTSQKTYTHLSYNGKRVNQHTSSINNVKKIINQKVGRNVSKSTLGNQPPKTTVNVNSDSNNTTNSNEDNFSDEKIISIIVLILIAFPIITPIFKFILKIITNIYDFIVDCIPTLIFLGGLALLIYAIYMTYNYGIASIFSLLQFLAFILLLILINWAVAIFSGTSIIGWIIKLSTMVFSGILKVILIVAYWIFKIYAFVMAISIVYYLATDDKKNAAISFGGAFVCAVIFSILESFIK